MKRFRRWLFNGLAALSLFLCVVTVALWVVTYHVTIESDFTDSGRGILSFHGVLKFVALPGPPSSATSANWNQFANALQYPVLQLPYWLITLTAAVLPVYWLIDVKGKRAKEKRTDAGLCAFCGYDLRATPDRCPECGAIPPKKETIPS